MNTLDTGQVRIRLVYDAPDGGYRVLVGNLSALHTLRKEHHAETGTV